MSEGFQKIIDSKLHWIASIAFAVFGICATFYSLTTRVAVNEEQIVQLRRDIIESKQTAEKYQDLAQSIDSRLSRIEGSLDANK